ncbi:hypothetical protein [Streptomyces odontomachi]|uniref:hypothetical protein n=1 Tax=Streptomyces odontomachi TaxID=2944940 RepID=UPI00210EBFEB|nr:hypothetical protein [Streptomyces sp. ODS25]
MEAAPDPSSEGLLRHLRLPAEVLLVGVLVCVAALPVVTSLAAAGAGAVLLRELVADDRTPTVRRFLHLVGGALRQPVALLAPFAVAAVAALDTLALLAGLPGGTVTGPPLALALVAVLLTGVRAAARWRPGDSWRTVLAEAAPLVLRDWPGSLMLVGALVVLGVVAAHAPAFVMVLPGLLVMAGVAVERRTRRPARSRS